MDSLGLAAALTGLAGLVSAAAGVMLAVRAARDKERKSAKAELDDVSGMLADERRLRLACERRTYDLGLLLARHGIDPDDSSSVH